MLEILYDTATKEVRAWNADMKVRGNFKPKEGQEVAILPIDPPTFDSDIYFIDLASKRIKGNPDYIFVEPFNPRAEIDGIKARLDEIGIGIIRKS